MMNIYGFLLLIAFVLAFFSIRNYYRTNELIRVGEISDATVIDFRVSNGEEGPVYAPVFQYKNTKKEVLLYEYDVYSSPKAYEVGQRVKLVYNPLDISERKIVTFWGLYRWSVILLMIASPLFVVSISYWWYLCR